MNTSKKQAFLIVAIAMAALLLIGCSSNMYVQSAKISINNLQDYNRARQQLLDGTVATPDDAEVWYWLGYVYFELAEYDSMLFAFDRSLSIDPEYSTDIESYENEAWRINFNAAVTPFNENNWQAAADLFELTTRIRPDNYESLKFSGICYLQMSDIDKAQEYFDRANEDPQSDSDLDLQFTILNMLWSQENWTAVVEQANYVLAMPDSILDVAHMTDAIAKKAISYFNMEDFENAISAWESAISQDPEFADYYFNVALLYEQLDRLENAETAYLRAIELAPQDEQARRRLANLYLRQQRWQELADIMVPWLFPSGEIAVVEPTMTEREVWNVLRVALLNLERIQDAEVVNQIMENL